LHSEIVRAAHQTTEKRFLAPPCANDNLLGPRSARIKTPITNCTTQIAIVIVANSAVIF
jgi:hypothetical protein